MEDLFEEIVKTNNIEYAKHLLQNLDNISVKYYWSFLFWKMPELLFICVNNSTKLSKELLSNSLNEKLLRNFDNTFHPITVLLPKLNDLLWINITESKELICTSNLNIPGVRDIITFYSIVMSTLFPFLTNDFLKSKEGLEFRKVLYETKFIIDKYIVLFKDIDRLFQRICLLNNFKSNFLNRVLNGIVDRMSQVPIVQHIKFN